MGCVFCIRNEPRRYWPSTGAASQFPLNQYYCYWVPATKTSWCDVHQSPVWHLIKCNIHQYPVSGLIKCTIYQSPVLCLLQVLHPSSLLRLLQLHHSTVLLHLLATILCHVIMLLVNSILSTILLLMWICLVDYKLHQWNLSSSNYRTCCHLPTHLFYCRDSASLTSFKSTFTALQLNY